MSNSQVAYLLARLAIAATMFGHGLVRLPKLAAFSEGMVAKFEKSVLPAFFVSPFSYVLVFTELTVGLLLLIGLWTRGALVAGALAMVSLIFGSCLIEEFGALPSQMIHAAYCCILLVYLPHNRYALDEYLRKS